MTSDYHVRCCNLRMLWLSVLFAFLSAIAFCSDEVRNSIPEGLLCTWFIGAIILTELTLLDSLRNKRLHKKVAFACLLHFVPIVPLVGYWWWKCGRGDERANNGG